MLRGLKIGLRDVRNDFRVILEFYSSKLGRVAKAETKWGTLHDIVKQEHKQA